nr:MAG TPA: hypothetical protein [Caudoviricetes sp.]
MSFFWDSTFFNISKLSFKMIGIFYPIDYIDFFIYIMFLC